MIHSLLNFLFTAFSFIMIISVIVFIHEFGHYLVAKCSGVKIDIFSLGFGKELAGFTDRTGTRWKISALPFGGYVKMFGDANEASTPSQSLDALSVEEKRRTFHFQPLYKKAAIVAAGPVSNFLMTIVILSGFIFTSGLGSTEPVVGEVLKDSAAQAAGLQKGDRIEHVNEDKVEVFNDISRLIMTNLGTPVILDVVRDNLHQPVTLTPKPFTEKDELGNDFTRPLIGIKSTQITYDKTIGIHRAVWEAAKATYRICTTTLHVIGQMISGDRDAKDIKGPIGIAKLSGQAAEKGFSHIFWLMAMLSANLGLINLFPIPMLDGGHLLYYGIEAMQGRPLAKRLQEYGLRIGMAMIVMLMAFAFFNDFRSF